MESEVWFGGKPPAIRQVQAAEPQSECHRLEFHFRRSEFHFHFKKGCRAPFGQTKQAPMISHLYQFYFKHCLFCFLVCLSKCVYLVIFSSFRSVECRQILWHTAEGGLSIWTTSHWERMCPSQNVDAFRQLNPLHKQLWPCFTTPHPPSEHMVIK